MTSDVHWMKPLRDAVGRFLNPDEVEEVFAEAMQQHGRPLEEGDLDKFVDRPLDRALKTRMDPVMRRAIIRGAHSIVSGTLHDTTVPTTGEYAKFEETEEPTTSPGRDGVTSFVLVAAGSKSMERGIRQAEPVSGCRTIKDLVALHSAVLAHSPGLWVIDATDPPALPAHELRRALDRLPSAPIVVVWGPGRPYGKAVLKQLENLKPPPITLTRKEPDALFDVVRSIRDDSGTTEAHPRFDEVDGGDTPTGNY